MYEHYWFFFQVTAKSLETASALTANIFSAWRVTEHSIGSMTILKFYTLVAYKSGEPPRILTPTRHKWSQYQIMRVVTSLLLIFVTRKSIFNNCFCVLITNSIYSFLLISIALTTKLSRNILLNFDIVSLYKLFYHLLFLFLGSNSETLLKQTPGFKLSNFTQTRKNWRKTNYNIPNFFFKTTKTAKTIFCKF